MKKNLKLKRIKVTNKNVEEQLKEINQKLKLEKLNIQMPSIDPKVMQQFKAVNENYKESLLVFTESFKKAMEQFPSFSMVSIQIQNVIQSIDWSRLREGLKVKLETFENQMKDYDAQLWAIDIDLFDRTDIDDELNLPSFEEMEEYVENRLDSYLKGFKKEDLYKDYISILEQSYFAFKSEQYALACFPLFAVIEGIMAKTFQEYEIDVVLKPKLTKKKNQLYYKLSDYVESTEDQLAFYLLFFRRVFCVYEEIFKPSWNLHPEKINRNWIMHGSYHYEKINKKDVLRLFQLVKALEVVKNITFVNEEKISG